MESDTKWERKKEREGARTFAIAAAVAASSQE